MGNKKVAALQPELGPGEIKVVALSKLILNGGRLRLNPGDTVILGPLDTGIHIDKLLFNKNVVPYESTEQVEKIREWWNDGAKEDRESLKSGIRADAIRRRRR